MAAGNIIDSFWVSLGFKAETAGLKTFQKESAGVRDSMLELAGVIGGIAAGGFALKKAIDVSSEFEQNQIAIAGFLQTLGFASDFNAGLQLASETIDQITIAAAKLPGEADEYIQVFRAGLPVLKAAMPGGSTAAMTDFTNMFTAVGKSLKIDANQIGRDLRLMLRAGKGGAGADVKTFNELLSFMRLIPGQANLSAASFNAMSEEARLGLLQQTMSLQGLQAMVDASANSFDAMWGAAVSGAKQLTRLGTQGLFKGIKDGLFELNALFFDDKGKLTEIGKDVVAIFKEVSGFVGRAIRDIVQLTTWFARLTKHSKAFRGVILAVGAFMAGGVMMKTLSILVKIGQAFRLASMMAGLLLVVIGLLIEDMYGYYTGAEALVDWNSKLGRGLQALMAIIVLLGARWAWLKIQSVGSAVASFAAWAAANLPLLAMLAVIGLLVFGLLELKAHMGDISQFFEDVINRWISGLNKIIDKVNLVLEAFGMKGIEHVGNVDISTKVHEPESLRNFNTGPFQRLQDVNSDARPAWLDKPGAAPGGSVVHSETHVGEVNINGNDDPRKMGDAWNSEVRDAQSGVAL